MFFFSYIISGVRNLNNGPCFVKSVNNRSVVCRPRIVGPWFVKRSVNNLSVFCYAVRVLSKVRKSMSPCP